MLDNIINEISIKGPWFLSDWFMIVLFLGIFVIGIWSTLSK